MRRNWIDAAIAAWRASKDMRFVHEALGISWDEWYAWTQGNASLLPPWPSPDPAPPPITSPRRVVLLAGAHGLDPAFTKARGTVQSKAWACSQIARFIAEIGCDGYVLAPHSWEGPNGWARDIAARIGAKFVAFAPNGRRYVGPQSEGDWTSRWCPGFDELDLSSPRDMRRIARDKALVAAVAHARSRGMQVTAHTFLAPWAGSVEASAITKYARRANLPVVSHECPAIHSPLAVARVERDRERAEGEAFARERGPWTYFVDDGHGFVKIGWSADPDQRRGQLQTGNASVLRVVLRVPGGEPVERLLHAVFEEYRVGGEWFVMGRRMLSFIWRIAQHRQKHGELTPARVAEIAHNPAVDTPPDMVA